MQDRVVRRMLLLSSFVALAFFATGCKKKVGNLPPSAPPPPVAAEPTVSINASTTSINAGDSVTLNWTSTNATDLNLAPGIGKVPPEGSQAVTPTESTSYQITATGPGGSAQASVRVTVNAASEETGPAPNPGMDQLFAANVKDAFYDFNKSDLRPDARQALTQTAEFLRQYPQMRVAIEGHCDERGSTEYNLGLGERRAQAARDFLVSLGISADRLTTVSYGKEKPFCTQSNEGCWQQNRRAHFVRAQ